MSYHIDLNEDSIQSLNSRLTPHIPMNSIKYMIDQNMSINDDRYTMFPITTPIQESTCLQQPVPGDGLFLSLKTLLDDTKLGIHSDIELPTWEEIIEITQEEDPFKEGIETNIYIYNSRLIIKVYKSTSKLDILLELDFLLRAQNINGIVKCYGFYYENNNIYILMEKLQQFELFRAETLLELIPTLAMINQLGIKHDDLHIDNIMTNSDDKHIIIDFGNSYFDLDYYDKLNHNCKEFIVGSDAINLVNHLLYIFPNNNQMIKFMKRVIPDEYHNFFSKNIKLSELILFFYYNTNNKINIFPEITVDKSIHDILSSEQNSYLPNISYESLDRLSLLYKLLNNVYNEVDKPYYILIMISATLRLSGLVNYRDLAELHDLLLYLILIHDGSEFLTPNKWIYD